MLPKTKTERHSDICKEINALYARKNHDYGDSFHQTFTEEGMAMPRIRLGDKLARFKSLTKSEVQEVKDESIRDTLIYLANYAIMTILELDDLKALGLCGEAGEVAEQVKKHFFHGHELDKRHMIEELGDVAWYLAVLCDAIGSDLDTVMEENLKKLEQRYPEGFDPYRSQHRNELGG